MIIFRYNIKPMQVNGLQKRDKNNNDTSLNSLKTHRDKFDHLRDDAVLG